jgi:hypothetical protein
MDSVAIADTDGDGLRDVISAGGTTVDVFSSLGGNHSFKVGAAQSAVAVAAADLNGDGLPDAVVADENGNSVWVLQNTGGGNLATAQQFTVGAHPLAVALADLNGDGEPDIVTANQGSDSASVLFNTTAAPAGGGSPNGGEASVTATVAPTLTVSVAPSLTIPALAVGQTSAPAGLPVTVTSNDTLGYELTVSRSAFTNGDLPLSIQDGTPSDAGMLSDLAGAAQAIPTSGALDVGHRNGTISGAGGDVWPTSVVLGPIPQTASGSHVATVTFTVTGL